MGESSLREAIETCVLAAGDIITGAENDRADHMTKSGHANFVTVYDQKVQEFLIGRLSKLVPEARFLGEEEGKDRFRDDYRCGLLYIIDPIDGTSNFMSGYYPYVISVALYRDGKPYIGVIYNPPSGQLFSAEAGCGAYMQKAAVRTRLHVSDKPLKESLVLFGTSPYRSDLSAETFRLAAAYLPACIDLRRSGAAAWDLCMIAAGHAGLYFECTLGIWDYAAGALIVTEAGGTVRQLTGSPLTFDGPSSILAYGTGVGEADLIFKGE